jgi:secreted trypsin-like serine protease
MQVRRGSVVQGCGRGGRRSDRRFRWGARRTGAVPLLRGLALLATALGLATALPGTAAGVVSPRIVGGAGVPIEAFPFQVALYDPHASSVSAGFFCGGVVIDATHVATAAHCAVDEANGQVTPPWDIAVLAGSSSLGSAQSPLPESAVQDPVVATSIDPNYSPSINDYDVAVLRLAQSLWSGAAPPLDGRSAIAPIQVSAALAATYANPATSAATILATVSGWGDTRAEPSSSNGLNGTYPIGLQATQIPLVANSACGSAYNDPLSSQPITARMLCAGLTAGGRDSCFGDSGGPLLVQRSGPMSPPGDYVLAGLVSFGEGCAQAESPGVYAAIANPAIAAFLNSDPPQTPLGQNGYARPRHIYACSRRRHRPCRAPVAHHHHRHHHKRAS